MKKNFKKIIGFTILFVVTGIVLYLSLKDNFKSIMHQIQNMNIFWVLFAIFLFIVYLAFRAVVTVKLSRKFNEHYRFWPAFKMEWEIIFFNAITPFSTGGKPYEIYALKRNGLKVVDASNVAIQNFIVYQIALVLLGLITLIYNHQFKLFAETHLLTQLVILGFLVNTSVIVLLFFITFAKKSNRSIVNFFVKVFNKLRIIKDEKGTQSKLHDYLDEFHGGAVILLKDKLKFIGMVFLHFISLLSLYSIPLIVLYGMGNYTSLNGFTSILASAYVMLIASFVPMPGGTGGIEYVFLVFYGNFISGSTLNAVMLVWRFITFYLGIVVGAIFLSRGKKIKS